MKVPSKALLVSVHDVTPAHAVTVRRIVSFLARRGVTAAGLLIVPDFHSRSPLGCDKPFAAYLGSLISAGWEPILHGFSHLDDGDAAPRRFLDRLARTQMTAGEGEFSALDGEEASRRLEAGLDVLEKTLGVNPQGFVPPAWLCSPEARQAIFDMGFAHSEDHIFIYDYVRSRRVFAPALGWASRSPRRRLSSKFLATCATPALTRLPVVRLALHPGDFRYPSLVRSIERSLSSFLEAGFLPMTYGEYLAA